MIVIIAMMVVSADSNLVMRVSVMVHMADKLPIVIAVAAILMYLRQR